MPDSILRSKFTGLSRCFGTQDMLKPNIPSLKGVKRKINELVPIDEIESIRIRHVMVQTEMMANDVFTMIREGRIDFSDVAASLSICPLSKASGGDLGWISVSERASNVPIELVSGAISLNKGDMTVVSSLSNGEAKWHVLQLVDVVSKLNLSVIKRRKQNYIGMKGVNENNLTYNIETMGCQMNIADSERMEGQLRDLGYRKVSDSSQSSLLILNTCSIREHAEQKLYSYIGPTALRKRNGEDVTILVAGCVAQQEGEALLKRFPEV